MLSQVMIEIHEGKCYIIGLLHGNNSNEREVSDSFRGGYRQNLNATFMLNRSCFSFLLKYCHKMKYFMVEWIWRNVAFLSVQGLSFHFLPQRHHRAPALNRLID